MLNKDGHLRGFILRKALCTLLKYKTFSFPAANPNSNPNPNPNHDILNSGSNGSSSQIGEGEGAGFNITSASTIFYDTIERNYPDYPVIGDIQLTHNELVCMHIIFVLLVFFVLFIYIYIVIIDYCL